MDEPIGVLGNEKDIGLCSAPHARIQKTEKQLQRDECEPPF